MNSGELDQRVAALSPDNQALLRRMLAARRQPAVRDISMSQHSMWYFDRLLGASPLYTIAWRVELDGPLDLDAFSRAVGLVVGRHEALRSRFAMAEGRPVQIVSPVADVPVAYDDLTQLVAEQAAATVDELIDAQIRNGMDLRHGPLVAVHLMRTAPDHHVLLLCVHHIAFDIVSTEVFFRDLAVCYDLVLTGGDPEAVPPAPQYAEFTAWQNERLRGTRLDDLVGFWAARLDGAPPLLDLPTDRPRPAVQTFRGAAYRFTVPAATTKALCELAAGQRCTPFMAFMAAFHLLMSRYSGQTDICVATPVANRTTGLENLIGLCLNVVVVRCDLSEPMGFRGLLSRIRETCLDVYEHGELPFDKLVEALAPDRALSHNPLAQVQCSLDRPVAAGARLGGATITSITGVHVGSAKFDLAFGAVLGEDHIAVTVDYATDLFDETTIATMAETFLALLDQVTADPDTEPTTPRIDRAASRATGQGTESDRADRKARAAYLAPRNDLEQVVVAMLANLLGEPRIGVEDNLFEHGGHSILVVKLLAQVSEVFDADLSLRAVLEEPTAAGLAARIASAVGADNAAQTAADAASLLGLTRATADNPGGQR